MDKFLNKIKCFLGFIVSFFSPFVVDVIYGGFWKFRSSKISKIKPNRFYHMVYSFYLDRIGSYIGESTEFKGIPNFPHNIFGIFISNNAKIGSECTIFHQVTIGANTLKGHPRKGSPVIGDNVYIGAGAKIIGKVEIGDNCRIGANCVVVDDMPPNTTAVASKTRYIYSDVEKVNIHQTPDDIKKQEQNPLNTPPRLPTI